MHGSEYQASISLDDTRAMAPALGTLAVGLMSLLILSQQDIGCRAEICTRDVCEYDFVLRYSQSMVWFDRADADGSVHSYDVQLNGSDLVISPNSFRSQSNSMIGTVVSPEDVITADGFQRNIITINGEFPGPTLEVMAGAQVRILGY